MKHYLDYNATAPVRPEVVFRMHALEGLPLNASSVHAYGRQAKMIIEEARAAVAVAVSAFPAEVVFTASGTEANNWALKSVSDHKLIVSSIEHSSVHKPAKNSAVQFIPVTHDGVLDCEALKKFLPSKEKFLVSVMLANNETGVIQPIRDIADIVHTKGGLLHCDAIQALGKIPVDFSLLGCDLMSISAHKMGGPVGAAALIIKNGVALPAFFSGGGQELGRRAGTENVPAIAGFARACELIDLSQMQTLRKWLNKFEDSVLEKAAVIGKSAARLPNTTCISMPGFNAEAQLISFDLAGIAVSAGSACSSGRIEPSHVLRAMQISDDVASTAIRISAGWNTSLQDVEAVSAQWNKLFSHRHAL